MAGAGSFLPQEKVFTPPEGGSQAFVWCYKMRINGALWTTANVGFVSGR